MAETTLYGIPTCETCRKARTALEGAGHAVAFVDVRKTPLGEDRLRRFHEAFGDKLVNRASATWRKLSDAEKEADPIALLKDHPTLMKRPVIEQGGEVTLGWSAATRSAYGVD